MEIRDGAELAQGSNTLTIYMFTGSSGEQHVAGHGISDCDPQDGGKHLMASTTLNDECLNSDSQHRGSGFSLPLVLSNIET